MKYMLSIFLLLAGMYLALVGGMYVFQRKLMYMPDRNIAAPEQYGLTGFADLHVTSPSGHKLQLWYREAKPGFPTIVYYHGNASHLGARAEKFGALAGRGFGLLALSYRGYGKSEGSPDEQGIYSDARAAIEFLNNQGIEDKQILLFGESLGSGVAVQMATEHTVGALVLEAPYTSVSGRAAEIYYFVPVKYLIHDKYHSIDKIAMVRAPLLIFHGELDATIPISHGRALYEAANNPKKSFFFPHIGHTDFESDVISQHVLDFAREHHLIAG
jgi:uncharacterized protein